MVPLQAMQKQTQPGISIPTQIQQRAYFRFLSPISIQTKIYFFFISIKLRASASCLSPVCCGKEFVRFDPSKPRCTPRHSFFCASLPPRPHVVSNRVNSREAFIVSDRAQVSLSNPTVFYPGMGMIRRKRSSLLPVIPSHTCACLPPTDILHKPCSRTNLFLSDVYHHSFHS